MAVFTAYGADVSALTGPPTPIATSATANTVKTLLQIKPNTRELKIIEWGYTFDGVPGAPVKCELVIVNVAATVTSLGSGAIKYNGPGDAASTVSISTSTSGFNASAEGTVTASRLVGYQFENGLYFKQQFPMDREPKVGVTEYLRLRFSPTTAAAVNVVPYVVWDE